MSKHQFCRDVALERGEPMEGTGALPDRLLLIRWPRKLWRESRSAAGMSPALADAMKAVNEVTSFGLFVDRAGGTETLPQLHAFPENVALDFPSEEALVAAMLKWTSGERLEGSIEHRITIICCTDSRTDACCARFGFATYKALSAAADSKLFNVMQCNHLGGCRFATSLAVLPRRERYGRLEPHEILAFLQSVAAGRSYLPKFRGRADMDEPGQVAELAALRWAATYCSDWRVAEISSPQPLPGQGLRFEAEVAGHRLQVDLEQRDFLRNGHCADLDGPGVLTQRWLVRNIEEISL